MEKPLLEIQNLSVSFRTDLGVSHSLNDVSLTLGRGRSLAVIGESGSGKSVMLRTILGITRGKRTDIRGSIRFENRELTDLTEEEYSRIRGKEIAMVFQDALIALDPVFTVGQQMIETIRRHTALSKPEARERTAELLRMVKIPYPEHRMNQYPHQMSGGMRQRVMIAMAIACNPKLLLADEPTTALDVTVQAQILKLMAEIQRRSGMSMIFVTHDIGVAANIADEIVVMYAGRIVEHGTVDEVVHHPKHPYTQGLIEANVTPGKKGRLSVISGQPPVPYRLPPGCSFAPRCAYAMEECKQWMPELKPVPGTEHIVRCHLQERFALNLSSMG